jgi:hypothetical protein
MDSVLSFFDPDMPFVAFPNRIRELRRARGFYRLRTLAEAVPSIPYIRLSRLERGESFARPDEIRSIAAALSVPATDLLPDPAMPPATVAGIGAPLAIIGEPDTPRKLAAAIRLLRKGRWTVSELHRRFHVPPVILARLEAGSRPLERWNDATRDALRRMFQVTDDAALVDLIKHKFASGELAEELAALNDPGPRTARRSRRMAALRRELGGDKVAMGARIDGEPRQLQVVGSPLAGSIIAPTPVGGLAVDAPRRAGPSAFALRVCAPTLGLGLPSHAVVIADPDVPALPGGIAVLKVGGGYRIMALGFGRGGAVRGLTVAPPLDIPFDGLDPADLSAVIAVVFP